MAAFTALSLDGAGGGGAPPPPSAVGGVPLGAGVPNGLSSATPSATGATPPTTSPAASATASAAAAASALSTVAALLPSSDAVRARLGSVWADARPWSEFFAASAFSTPSPGAVAERLTENGRTYAMNYLSLLLVLGALTLLASPLSLLGGGAVAAAYWWLFVVHAGVKVRVGGVEWGKEAKAVAMFVGGGVVLWATGAGGTAVSLLVVGAVLGGAHAVMRKLPGEADFESGYIPATV